MALAGNTFDMGGDGRISAAQRAAGFVVAAGAVWRRVFVAQIVGRHGRLGIRGKNVGANPLTAMRLLRTMRRGGMEVEDFTVLATDADFGNLNGTMEIQSVTPAAPQSTAAGAAFDMVLNAAGIAEYALEVQSTLGTTLDVDITVD